MITHSSRETESGCERPRSIQLPLILPQTSDNPRRQINRHEAITAEHLAELGLLPAEEPMSLGVDQKYGEPQLVDGIVVVAVIDLSVAELDARVAMQLQSDLQQATVSSAILITEVFAQLYASGYLDVGPLSDKAKEEFATLTDLVDRYTS